MTTQDLAVVVIAISAAVVALAFVIVAISVRGLSGDVRDLAQHSEALVTVLERDLPPTIQQVRELGGSIEELTTEAKPRLKRVDSLLQEAEATLIAVREVSNSLNGLVGGPAATVSSVRRSVKTVGEGVMSAGDRIRRAISRDDDDEDDEDDA